MADTSDQPLVSKGSIYVGRDKIIKNKVIIQKDDSFDFRLPMAVM